MQPGDAVADLVGLQPHGVDSFTAMNDPHFTDKLIDVVGRYRDPPDQAVVLCLDEEGQLQPLPRTDSWTSLPVVKRSGRHGDAQRQAQRHHDAVRGAYSAGQGSVSACSC